MDSNRNQPEGIALLSMYNDDEDEEDDNDMEANEEPRQLRLAVEEDRLTRDDGELGEDCMDLDPGSGILFARDEEFRITNQLTENHGEGIAQFYTTRMDEKSEYFEVRQRTEKSRLTIVDYGHDEVTMSPELEVQGSIFVEETLAEDASLLRKIVGVVQVLSPGSAIIQPTEHTELSRNDDDATFNELMAVPANDSSVLEEDERLLDNFLPPPTTETCPAELQRRIERFLALKKVGRSYNAEVRNRKEYRNPDFLLHAVRYQDIDQIGSCFNKDVFDPHGYDTSDYYDEIELDMRREREKKEQELKKSPKVEFVAGGTQAGLVMPLQKFGGLPPPVSGFTQADAPTRDGRHNKKSKWDTMKVEDDPKISVISGSNETLSSTAINASLVPSTNVNAYVQQKRRDAEEKWSERKFDRKS